MMRITVDVILLKVNSFIFLLLRFINQEIKKYELSNCCRSLFRAKRIDMPDLSRFSGKILHERSECGDFSTKPRRGLTFTGQKRHGDTFARRKEKGNRSFTYPANKRLKVLLYFSLFH